MKPSYATKEAFHVYLFSIYRRAMSFQQYLIMQRGVK